MEGGHDEKRDDGGRGNGGGVGGKGERVMGGYREILGGKRNLVEAETTNSRNIVANPFAQVAPPPPIVNDLRNDSSDCKARPSHQYENSSAV